MHFNFSVASHTRAPRRCAAPRRCVRVSAAPSGDAKPPNPALVKALESALQAVSKIITNAERKRKADNSGGAVTAEAVKFKTVSFKAGSSGERLVKAPHLLGRTLSDYLALPLDAYSLLDPKWISRDPNDPTLFQLVVPLQGLTGLDLEPCIFIRVDLDPANSQVFFHATRFSVGQPKFDRNFKLEMKARLQHRKVPEVIALPSFDFWRSSPESRKREDASPMQPDSTTQTQPSSSNAATVAPEAQIIDVEPAAVTASKAASSGNAAHFASSATGAVSGAGHGVSSMPDDITVNGNRAASQSEASHIGTASSTSHDAGVSMDGNGLGVSGSTEPDSSDERRTSGNGASSSSTSESADLTESSAVLWCNVDVQVEAMVPYPLSAVPGPLLNLTASLLTKFTIQQLLPAFLQLLSVDYSKWAVGEARGGSQPAGSLLTEAVTVNGSDAAVATLLPSRPSPEPTDKADGSLPASPPLDVTPVAMSERPHARL